MFELVNNEVADTRGAIIKVIGVGGAGGNAVRHMYERELQGVELFCANTDMQALSASPISHKIQIGRELTRGLGAGANPEIGRDAAAESREQILSVLQGADMLFIAAGMGGGTGTGAAPVIAELARSEGVLTVAVVTKPFTFEGKRRIRQADEGIQELVEHVDSLIVVPNDRLLAVMENATVEQAFAGSNSVLHGAVQGISDLIINPGVINVDFADVRTVMMSRGIAMMGTGSSNNGEHAATEAAEKAISSPFLESIDLASARGILINITAGPSFKINEYERINTLVQDIAQEDATVISGTAMDESLEDEIRVTIVATGIDGEVGMSNFNTPMASKANGQVRPNGATPHTPLQNELGNTTNPQAQPNNEPRKTGFDLDIPAFIRKRTETDNDN